MFLNEHSKLYLIILNCKKEGREGERKEGRRKRGREGGVAMGR
jgi:hypothetical protein